MRSHTGDSSPSTAESQVELGADSRAAGGLSAKDCTRYPVRRRADNGKPT
jgi:hypothetical protein